MEVIYALEMLVIGVLGGSIMAYTMFKLLPGMKTDAYPPKEWLSVSVVLGVMAYMTYFVPQIVMNSAFQGAPFLTQLLLVGITFAIYTASTILTLIFLQCRKRKG